MSKRALLVTILLTSLCLALPATAQTTQPAGPGAASPAPAASAAPAAIGTPAPGATEVALPESGGGAASPAPSPSGPAVGRADGNRPIGEQPGGLFGSQWMLFLMVGVLVLMFVLSGRSRRKQEKKRAEMLAAMKKGDRVTTIGGIIGTLIEVRDQDVVVKVDEQNNTRMRFLRSAIAQVGEGAGEKEQAKS